MMNKKIAQAILIVGVLGIWGMIAYRLLKNSEVKADFSLPTHSLVDDKPRKPKETIQLSLNYEDPFLKTVGANHHDARINDESKTRKKTQPVKSSPTKPLPLPVAPIKWPELTFKGIIENKKKGKFWELSPSTMVIGSSKTMKLWANLS
jgi:hypothetical protein